MEKTIEGRKRVEAGGTRYFSRPRAGNPPHLHRAHAGGQPAFEGGPFGLAG